MADFKMPKTGLPYDQADTKDLEYWANRKDKEVAEGRAKYPDSDKAAAAAMRAELARRAAGGAQAQAPHAAPANPPQRAAAPAASTALARTAPKQELSLSTRDPAAITAKLTELAASYHMVMPATRVDVLPEGCGIAVSFVTVNPSTERDGPKEVYQVGDRLGLSGDTLKRIAAAAGVDWDPNQSGRLDDGRDPHYCHYRAVAKVRNFDGSLRTVTGEVEIDAREGSPLINEIREKATKRAKQYNKPDDGGASQILELRKFLLRHAESKAKNRAIADMGLKRSYAPAELQKPFAVARLMWTGQSSDPELRREFARMGAERMLDGNAALYGRNQPQQQAAPAPHHGSLPPFQGHSPPPLAPRAARVDASEFFDDDSLETTGEPATQTPLPAPAPAPAPAAAPQQKAKPPEPPPGAGDAYEGDDPQPSLPGTAS